MKIVTLTIALLSSLFTYCQAYPNDVNHEIKFNIGLFMVNSTIEGSYEYFLNEDTSIGGTIYSDSDADDYNGNFGIGPNFRAYFGYQPRSGVFAEVFGLYYTGEEPQEDPDSMRVIANDYNTLALGLGIGNKWVTQSERFSIEGFAGVGRNINEASFQDTFMYRLGVSIGFRF